MKELEYAWAAGFFDGEGSVICHRKYATIKVNQKEPELLHKLKSIFDVGYVRGPYFSTTVKGKSTHIHEWTVTKRKDVVFVFELMKPYLGFRKREQFENVLIRFNA
jgi:hypothetical protein